MADREVPYGAFNYVVEFDGGEIFGGFSEVSGIGMEISTSDYREGTDKENHVHKVPGTHTVSDVTLKRGVIDSSSMFEWLKAIREQGPSAMKDVVTITMQNEAHEPVQKWNLRKVTPITYTGPSLAAAGGGDVATEELVLATEGFEIAAA